MQNILSLATQAAGTAAGAAGNTASTQQSSAGSFLGMLPMIIVFAVIIYLMWRGQKKEQKRRQEMVDSIKAGDQVLTVAGIFGEIIAVKDDQFIIKIADNVKINVVKTAVGSVIAKDAKEAGKEEQK